MENTRVFVSGLPPTFSNDQLRKHFSTRFQVTDAHVLPKRRIGFVGFKSPEAAKEAVAYFNKTYIKLSKISVDIAKPVCACALLVAPLPTPLSFLPLRSLTDQGGLETDQNGYRSTPNLNRKSAGRRVYLMNRLRTPSSGSVMVIRLRRTRRCRNISL
jgi:RNA recognition motif-containing protein